MINYVILVCVAMLSFTMLMAGFRAQNTLKYEDSDRMARMDEVRSKIYHNIKKMADSGHESTYIHSHTL